MKGCLLIGGGVILICALIIGAFLACATGNFILGGILVVLSIVIIVLMKKRGTNINNAQTEAYIKENPNIGFFRPLNKNTKREKWIDFDIIEGPTTNETMNIDLSNMNYVTYFLNAGEYTANVKYTITTMNSRYQQRETVIGEQTIKFKISPRRLHTLDYNKKTDEYSFEEIDVPKELNHILNIMDKN